MEKIQFKDLPDTTTPLSASNLNTMQDNIEEAIDEVQDNLDITNTYSTDEVNTGMKWIDGKPIYRKVVSGTTNNTNNTTITTISNLENVINIYGYVINSNAINPINIFTDTTNRITYYSYSNNGNIMLDYTDNYKNKNYYVVIEYTKTTD